MRKFEILSILEKNGSPNEDDGNLSFFASLNFFFVLIGCILMIPLGLKGE